MVNDDYAITTDAKNLHPDYRNKLCHILQYSMVSNLYIVKIQKPNGQWIQSALKEDELSNEITQFINKHGDHDKFWGITGRPNAHFANGYWWGTCTGYAVEIRTRLGAERVVIKGFHANKNPRSEISEKSLDGHDFAIVDNRWIVDPWVKEMKINNWNYMARGIYDLDNPNDFPEIHRLYGDQDTWEVSTVWEGVPL